MTMKKRTLTFVLLFASLLAAAIWGIKEFAASDTMRLFQPLTVTVRNESDFDIVSMETGIVEKGSKDVHDKSLPSGGSVKLKPRLALRGEGAVYLRFADSRGDSKVATVCGYTEYLSGKSVVTIGNNSVTVDEDCR